MAKKAAPKKPMKANSKPPKSEAKPIVEPKAHERKAKPSETDRLEKGRALAASYLVQRDSMDLELATMVVAGMDADAVNELITEANTKTIASTNTETPTTGSMPKESEVEEIIPDFLTIPALAEHDEFSKLTQGMIDASKRKNEAEAEYKANKARVIAILKSAGVKKLTFLGYTLTQFPGKNTQLNAQLLIEAGVDPAIVNKCYKDSPFEDIRVSKPGAPKNE